MVVRVVRVVKVIDASALAAMVFGEPVASIAARLIGDADLIAPKLLSYEMANIAVTKARRHPELRDILLSALRRFLAFPIEYRDVDFAAVAELANAKGLSGYDAAYLWLALDTGAPHVTLDRQLAAAAKYP